MSNCPNCEQQRKRADGLENKISSLGRVSAGFQSERDILQAKAEEIICRCIEALTISEKEKP